jgi:hypothetical protein
MQQSIREEVAKIWPTLQEGESVKITFIPDYFIAPIQIGAKIAEVTPKHLIINVMSGGLWQMRIIKIERIHEIVRIHETKSEIKSPEVSNRYVRMIREKVKYPNTDGEYGAWDGLPLSVRQFLVECADYMLVLEVMAHERDILDQQLRKAEKTLANRKEYEEALDMCDSATIEFFRRGSWKGNAENKRYALFILRILLNKFRKKWNEAQDRQYHGGKPSGRMRGLCDAMNVTINMQNAIIEGKDVDET